MITPSTLAIILQGAPFPDAVFTVTPGGAAIDITADGATITFCEGAWFAAERRTTPAHLSFASTPTAEQVHAEIRRVLAVVKDDEDHRRDVEAQLAQVTAERDAALAAPAQRLALLDDLLVRLGAKTGGALEALDRLDLTIETLRGERDKFAADLAVSRAHVNTLSDRVTQYNTDYNEAKAQIRHLTAERDALDVAESTLSKIAAALAIPALEPHDDALSMVKRLVDGYAVVSQRLIGSQKEVAERDATIESNEAKVIDLTLRLGETQNRVADLESELAGVRDNADRLRRDLDFMNQRRANAQKRVTDLEQQRDDYQAAVEVQRTRANVNDTRATKAEARVKRLIRQRNAAHDVLDEAGIGLEVEGSPRWTLARRCRAAVAPVWGYLDALQAFDVVGEIVGVTGKTGERGFIDAVIARVKALRNDDDTRAAIAVAVGLDDSASLGLILDTVKSADTTKDTDLARLVNYHQAPVTFNARPLTLAERASFVIRRLWQGRTNAANEATSLRRELSDIADALGDLPDTAEREPIGDREEHLGLSTAERIRLSR